MRKMIGLSLMALSLCAAGGCKSGGSSGTASTQQASEYRNDAPAGTPFAQVKEGMSRDQVQATIGPPTNFNTYQTGKMWIPFHFGGDNFRGEAHYKGQGYITYSSDSSFSSGMSVMNVHYDPTDPGYAKDE